MEEYIEYGFPINGLVSGKDWEVFGAILLEDEAADGYCGNGKGADLQHYEVKSCVNKNGNGCYEYQYHRNTGHEKLKEETELVDHAFIFYKPKYKDFEVWTVNQKYIQEHTEGEDWSGRIRENYEGTNKQRCRLRVPHTLVKDKGELILKVVDSKVVLSNA